MTLTADRRPRTVARAARSAAPSPLESIPAAPASPPVRAALTAVLARDDVYRVTDGETVFGYVQVAGPVFVTLLGPVYNTSVEIAQCLDLDTAIARLERARG